jgi:TetR/AcrR family transcriptional regulator
VTPLTRATAAAPTSRRAQRKAQLQELARNQLLDAAEEVFGAKGIHGTTIKEIAERAEFSVGSVYSFFDSKDDLFVQVLERRGIGMIAGIRDAVTGEGTALERLQRLVEFEVGFFREHRSFARLYLESSAIGPLLPGVGGGRHAEEELREAMALTAGLFAEGQADGEFCGGDPAVLARLLSGIVSAYQATDPIITTDGPAAEEPLALDDLRALVARAFAR